MYLSSWVNIGLEIGAALRGVCTYLLHVGVDWFGMEGASVLATCRAGLLPFQAGRPLHSFRTD